MGEQPLPKNFCCNLGSLNLAEFVLNKFTEEAQFDFEGFSEAIKIAVRGLDKLVDLNADNHPLKEQRENSLNYRNIGLGVFGYADMLMMLGVKYGTKQALDITDKVFKVLLRLSVYYSNELAKELGSFPKYQDELFDSDILKNVFLDSELEYFKKDGLRNCSLISIAPTGSIGTMMGRSGGCEPEFSIKYTRKTESLNGNNETYYDVFCQTAKEYMDIFNGELPDYFVGSSDISYKDRVKAQSVMQEYVDTAISSTVNLPNSATVEDIEELYLYAWEKGLKGITVYRDGCKRSGILTTNGTNKDNIPQELSRGYWKPKAKDTVYYQRKVKIGCGKLSLFIGWSDTENSLQDLYVQRTGQGGCEKNIQSTVISMSGMLRLGGNIFNIEKAFEGLGACNSFVGQRAKGVKLSKGSSCGTAMLNEIKLFIKEKEENITPKDKVEFDNKEKCPECGEPIIHDGGCNICVACGD